MSVLKRRRDTFYIDSPSKRPVPGSQRKPLSTFQWTDYPSSSYSSINYLKIKNERLPYANREPEYTKRTEEEEPESQLPASVREDLRQNLQLEYDELKLAFNDQVYKTKTLEGELSAAQAQLASSQKQLDLLRESHQALMNDFHNKNQKSLQTERRLRAERDQYKGDLGLVGADRDAAVLERDVAQSTVSRAEEELREYQQFFALHSRLLTRAQALS
ncbi:hypothetical protein F5880DRAFT_1613584 [Lentinula raphanica]|nr:hypothetical protein F5880DRAFT_1613584 [Lentinula raphanica]